MNSGTKISVFFTVFVIQLAVMVADGSTDEFYHDERNSLIQIRDSLGSTLNLHSNWTGPPCHFNISQWIGITCLNSHVISVVLEGIQLTGSLQANAFQNITYLVNLSLSNNALRGDLPILKGLDHLKVLLLSRNRFSGQIPIEFVELPSLSRLELQDNLLNGMIPPFDQQNLSVFNVSYNFLEGPIPGTSALQRFPNSSYDHNLNLCGKPLDKPCPVVSPPSPMVSPPAPKAGAPPPYPILPSASSTKTLEWWSIALIAVAAVMVPFLVIFCFLCYYRRNQKKRTRERESSGEASIELAKGKMTGSGSTSDPERIVNLEFFDKERPVFDLDDLLSASAEVMGKSRLGTTYKAILESGQVITVKRLKEMNELSKKEFVQQMQLLGKMRHENLVEIISFYYSATEKLVIYEHVPDGSLFQLLHDNRGEGRMPLNWAARLCIVKGIAKGLAYLHQSLPSHKVPHANLKSSNVLILHNDQHPYYHPKLTDFGFQPLLLSPNNTLKLAAGKTPEFLQGKRLTYKSDIYCFGLILLEVITGQIPNNNEGDLAEWVRSVINNDWSTDILDLEILAEKEGHAEMLKLTDFALECTALEPERRPKMSEVVKRIEEIKEANDEERT